MLFRLNQICLLLITGMLFTACTPQYSGKVPPKVINGEIDLTGWDFAKDGPVNLDGDWLFAWEKFVEPASWEQLQKEMVHTLPVPGYWHTMADPTNPKQNFPRTGYASYAIKISGITEKVDLGSVIRGPYSASKLFWLTEQGLPLQIKPVGNVAKRKQAELPKMYSYIHLNPSYLALDSTKNSVILLQVSNHHYSKGGPWNSIRLGIFEKLQLISVHDGQIEDLMTGILLILGLYHLVLFLQRKQDKAALYFSLFCLAVALRLFSMGVARRAGFVDTVFAWELLIKLEYLTMPLFGMSFTIYLFSMVPGKLTKLISHYSYVAGLPLLFFVIVTSPLVFSAYLWLFQLYLVIGILLVIVALTLHSLQRNRDAIRLLLSFLLMAFGIINDILHTNGAINSTFLAPYTTILFLLLQASFISYKNAKAYKTAEHLTEKLSAEVAAQTKKLNRIQFLSQQIQNTSDLDTMIQNLNQVLVKEFNISGYSFFLLNKKESQLESLRIETVYRIPEKIKLKLYQTALSLVHPKSLHGAILRKGKPYFLPRFFDIETAPDEMKYLELTGMKSLFIIPLKIDGEVFAALTMVDTKFQEVDRIKFLTREERAELVQLSQFVSSALYQALQKEQIQKAKDEAEQAQAAASRAKNEAAINQLAAHLAHEVNNPLNYIATGKIMQSDSFEKHHAMILDVLTGDDEDSLAFKEELEKLQDKFNRGLEQTNEGQDRIAKVIAEIRAITGVDGLNFTNFDAVAVLKEELAYSLQRNNLKSNQIHVKETGTDDSVQVLSNVHILARSIRTVISNCIHFAREHKGDDGELYIDCNISDGTLLIEIGNNSNSIKTKQVEDMFDLEKSKPYGTEQIGLAMIKELLHKINADLVLTDHGRESGKVIFQLQVPLES